MNFLSLSNTLIINFINLSDWIIAKLNIIGTYRYGCKTLSLKTELYVVPDNHAGKMRVFYRLW